MNTEIIAATLILTVAAWIDWKEHRVPNWLTYSALACGLAYHSIIAGVDGLTAAMLGAVVGLGTLIVPYALRGMGAGDVKLMAAVGAWVGAASTVYAFLWIAVIGGIMGMYSIVRSRQMKERMAVAAIAGRNLVTLNHLDSGVSEGAPDKILLPYGVPIAFGFYAYFIYGGLVG